MTIKPIKIKTDFYDTFSCIADKCSITCCQEWKIEVDEDTLNKWNKLYEDEEKKNCLSCSVEKKEGFGIIQLNEEKQCPFLNQEKLCRLVMRHGEEVLSKTCATFPREIHDFADRKEYSLVACCPEVVDILNKQEKIGFLGDTEKVKDDLFAIRHLLIEIVKDEKFSINKGLMIGYYILLNILEGGKTKKEYWEEYEDSAVLEQFAETIDRMEFQHLDTFDERNELFLDLAENYRKEGIYTRYLEHIAELAEKYAECYEEEELLEDLERFEQEISKYNGLFRKYLVSDIFNECLIPDSDFESMVMLFQWIAMEYVMMRHAVFLNWKLGGCQAIPYEMVRDCIVIQSRMTGYDEEDIKEYLENSFQSFIWEWGYLALIVGLEM